MVVIVVRHLPHRFLPVCWRCRPVSSPTLPRSPTLQPSSHRLPPSTPSAPSKNACCPVQAPSQSVLDPATRTRDSLPSLPPAPNHTADPELLLSLSSFHRLHSRLAPGLGTPATHPLATATDGHRGIRQKVTTRLKRGSFTHPRRPNTTNPLTQPWRNHRRTLISTRSSTASSKVSLSPHGLFQFGEMGRAEG